MKIVPVEEPLIFVCPPLDPELPLNVAPFFEPAAPTVHVIVSPAATVKILSDMYAPAPPPPPDDSPPALS